MGKMKDKFIDEVNRSRNEQYHIEYLEWCNSQGFKSLTQDENEQLHKEWWDSLTDKQKSQLCTEQEESYKASLDADLDEYYINKNCKK